MKGTYLTYKAWLAAVRKAGAVRLDGDKDIAMAFDAKGKGVGEWDGAEGQIYRKSEMRNPLSRASSASSENMVLDIVADLDFKPSETAIQLAISYVKGLVSKRDGLFRIISDPDRMRKVRSKVIEILVSNSETKRNPMQRESPLYVKYLSLMSNEEPFMMQGTKYQYVWAEYPGGVKDIGVYSYANDLVYSYDSFRSMMNLPNPLTRRKGESVRDFTARCMSEEKMSFPKTKQRIAVCLSKSRKRNPLESGATISDDEDINFRASNMG